MAARTPHAVADARFVGLDLEQWLAEDLIDVLIPAGPHECISESLREVVALGHKFEVPVYPCIAWPFWHYWAFLDLGSGEHRTWGSWVKTLYGGHPNDMDKQCYIVALNSWEGSAVAWRGAATNAWKAGADGIYVFNAFHSTPFERWREIGDSQTLANLDKMFGAIRFSGESNISETGEHQLKKGEPVRAHFQIGDDVTSGNVSELRFRLHLWDLANDDDMDVKLNGGSLDDLKREGSPRALTSGQWLECQLNPEQVKKGENEVELTVRQRDAAMSTPLVVDAVQLHVQYGG